MPIKFLIDKFKESAGKDAIIWKDTSFKYEWLLERFQYWKNYLKTENISPGTVTVVEADFSPNAVSLLLALIGHQCIIVPLTSSVEAQKPEFIGIAEGEVLFSLDDNLKVTPLPYSCKHDFYKELKRLNRPGLVLFSSGSTGKCKAMVHDLLGILEKFKVSRHCLRSVTFLLFDHIGGINTLLYVLSNGGCLITLQSREPDEVLRTIEKFKGELLPTSPTFINLILL